jgi:hypothetical protein
MHTPIDIINLLAIGGQEYKAYELECEILRAKRNSRRLTKNTDWHMY